jgi:hypothetical protein
MKKVFLVALCAFATLSLSAQSEQDTLSSEVQKNNWGAKLKESNFHLCLDLQTKYIWRGVEMMTENSAPVLFPGIFYSNKGFYVYVLGGYAINGKWSCITYGINYTYKWLTVGVNDYYYPTTTSPIDQYFNYKPRETGHLLEAVVTIAPEKVPLWLTVSNFFYGADRYIVTDSDSNLNVKQAYSTYAELGTYYDFLNAHRLSLALGAALNKSCYNGYQKGFSICNIELKYTYNLAIKDFILPLSAMFIYNPVCNKAHVNFQASFAF